MKENRRKGGKQERKDAALVLHPLCPRRNEHHHLRQEELTVLSSFSQRTEVLQPPLFHLGQRQGCPKRKKVLFHLILH